MATRKPTRPAYDPASNSKRCGRCGDRKSTSEFNRRSSHGADPFAGYCRSCAKARYLEWAEKNRAHKIAYLKRIRLEKIEIYRAYDVVRWARPETKTARKARVAANYDRYRGYAHARRAREISAPGRFTAGDIERIKTKQLGKCIGCRKKLGARYHIDHIVPLSRGGSNFPSNLQLLCPFCNRSKGATDNHIFMQRRGFML